MNVCIIGAGYVGLVTGACFAQRGHCVRCVDNDPERVQRISRGEAPIYEAGLSELLEEYSGTRLVAQTNLKEAIDASEIVLICVGTPFRDGKIDLSYVEAASEEIGHALKDTRDYKVIVVKSTVVPGTTEGIVRSTLERASGKRAGQDFGLGMNPEFLTEGTAVQDFMSPDRIVIGSIDDRSRQVLVDLYESWPDVPRVFTTTSTAEMIKYASNAVLATLISFSNEIGRLCEATGGVDVADVLRGVHLAQYFTIRIQGQEPVVAPITSFLGAGCGFGGSCLPKDVSALVSQGSELSVRMPLLSSVLQVNQGQPEQLVRLIRKHFPDLEGVRVAVLGLSFKPDTDDVRESPAFPVIRLLKSAGAEVVAYDPVARPSDHPALQGVSLAQDLDHAIGGAKVVVIVTSWKAFSTVPDKLRDAGLDPLIVDGRRMLSPLDLPRYEGIGRGTTGSTT